MTDPLLDSDADLAALLATARREALEEAARVADEEAANFTRRCGLLSADACRGVAIYIRALAASPAPREPAPDKCSYNAWCVLRQGHSSGCLSDAEQRRLTEPPPAPSQQTGDAERRCLCRRYPLPINVGSQLQIDGLWHGTTFCDELAPPSPASQTTQDKEAP